MRASGFYVVCYTGSDFPVTGSPGVTAVAGRAIGGFFTDTEPESNVRGGSKLIGAGARALM